MESIQSALQMLSNDRMQQQYEEMKADLLRNPHIQQFLSSKSTITTDMIERSISALHQYSKELDQCHHCPGLDKCPNLIKGFKPELILRKNYIDLEYAPCDLKIRVDEEKKLQSLIKSLYIPKEIMNAKFDEFDPDNPSRLDASQAAYEFATTVIPGETSRGLYLYGKFGVGKTYIMGAIANELKERRIETMLVYTPDFFREMRHSLSDGSFNEKLDRVKRAQVLILDDMGAETMSAWIRDEVLGVVLQHRMLEKLPTLYTSNYSLEELEEHMTYSDKGGYEELKAKRIMERIRHYTVPIFIDGVNRRG
ncbi:primosomal protein DnaI [Alkalihalobacillus sp. LMS39]|uniref:primosomal protein DnaI n=1 Tax=Alkalihalobacillus sp. LMS39 TaxID=2924032 RepID=UPI001FB3C3FA|nr:primosomal protein DnaI [Alkalihalobacillus sp. LMS39]UOE93403.1 primosomal protein DnaI [Alkalihalobacillus sp. LMS39]